MNIKRRLYLVVAGIGIVIACGTLGYYLLSGGNRRLMDCLYMTVISITTVGYGEVLRVTGNAPTEVFTMLLITFGMGIILYGISTLTALLIEGELTGILKEKKMRKAIEKLRDHFIVCGGGETGLPVMAELAKNKESVVLVEMDKDKIDRCASSIESLLYIHGDATDDENLIAAGIARAAGIAVCLPSDKDNLYITMTARMLNRAVRIISRMVNQKLEPKLKKAGANSVVSPNAIGALRIASEMLRPTVVDFLDRMLRSSQGNLRIHQLSVHEGSAMVGKTIRDAGLKDRYGLLVLGSRHDGNEIFFNPPPDTPLADGMVLIVMGDMEDIAKAQKAF
jgi:voltage-gated potassium channel